MSVEPVRRFRPLFGEPGVAQMPDVDRRGSATSALREVASHTNGDDDNAEDYRRVRPHSYPAYQNAVTMRLDRGESLQRVPLL